MYFIFITCLISIARIPRIMLNERAESGYLCIVPDIRGKVLIPSPTTCVCTSSPGVINQLVFLLTPFRVLWLCLVYFPDDIVVLIREMQGKTIVYHFVWVIGLLIDILACTEHTIIII